ncbi:hypothetical protein IPG36_06710 [bacterium]|nr:MAG: hypothetical protein IPG36_06710 [bacterium]
MIDWYDRAVIAAPGGPPSTLTAVVVGTGVDVASVEVLPVERSDGQTTRFECWR